MKMTTLQKNLHKILPDFGVCSFAELKPHLLACRAASRLPAGAKSVIVAVFPYLLPEEYYVNRNVARFAAVPDYHKIVLERLEKACDLFRCHYPEEEFVSFTDNSPIPEKLAAQLCGLGIAGQNSLFIHPLWGSWVFLGCIVCTINIEQLTINNREKYNISCHKCKACIKACPAEAIIDGSIDKTKCLSFRSQGRCADRDELAKLSGVLWGCDICQEVCPMNNGVPAEPLAEFITDARPVFDPLAKERVWAWRVSP